MVSVYNPITPWRPPTAEIIIGEGEMEIDKVTHHAQPGFWSLDPFGDTRHADRP